MKLTLIKGAAGTGKSYTCLAQIAKRLQAEPLGAPLLLLVPEQATFLTERALTGFAGVGATLRAQVLGFTGLYRWLATEASYPQLPWLDEQGRSMLLLACVQEKLPDLQLLKPAAKNASFMDLLARTLVEFEQYNIGPDDLTAAVSALPNEPMLAAKLQDLAIIYRAYLQRVQGGFRDQAVMMQELKAAAAVSERLKGAEVWLDGFMDINPSQMAVLREIFIKAKSVTLTLTLPPGSPKRLFGGQHMLCAQFERLAKEVGAQIEVITLEEGWRHRQNDELAALAGSFATGRFAAVKAEEPQHVHWLAAADPTEEAELAVQTIARLCAEKNYKFRDIAVITRQIADYRVPLENAFRDFGIPCFFDMGRDVSHHPLVKLVAEVLAVLHNNWSTPAVLAYLKSGLADILPDEADLLENYALRVGLRGTMWQQAGSFKRGTADELPMINELALRGLKPLLALAEATKQADTVGQYAAALLDFLAAVNAAERMEEWAQNAVQQGDLVQAEAHRQIYDKVCLLLQELADFLGDMPADARRFAEFWREGAARLALSSIPPSANQVNVADISRSRLPEIKAAIVLGLAEGVMPAVAEENGLLLSRDKELLDKLGINLAPGGRTRQFAEDYLLYLAFTRSSEELYLLSPSYAADGSAVNLSSALEDIRRVLPGLVVKSSPELYRLGGDRALLKGLSSHLAALKAGAKVSGGTDRFWRAVCLYLRANGMLTNELELLADGLGYSVQNAPLNDRQLAMLYPQQKTASVSRLESFNNCPCRYYAQYGLNLAPREEFKLRSMDIGNLYHYVLAEVIAGLAAAKCDWRSLQAADVIPLIDKAMQDFTAGGLGDVFADNGKNTYAAEKIKSVLLQTVLDMAANLGLGLFSPAELEISFGRGADGKLKAPMITLTDGRKIKLVGQIDRVDTASGTDAEYLRVIDYKMRNKTLKPADIYYGLNWQLPFYLQALLGNKTANGKKLKPAGMFYVPVQEIIKSVKEADDDGAAVKLQGLAILDIEALTLAERDFEPGKSAKTMPVYLKKDNTFGANTKGLTPAEYDFMQACLNRQAGQTLTAMLNGDISQRPVINTGHAACEFCDYYALCALDLAVEPKGREVQSLSSGEVIARLAADYPDIAQQFNILSKEDKL